MLVTRGPGIAQCRLHLGALVLTVHARRLYRNLGVWYSERAPLAVEARNSTKRI